MEDTGKKLTPEQIQAVKENQARPVMYITGGHRIGGDEGPQEMVHRFALQNGLPEITGFYGADLSTGTIYKV